MGRWLDRYLAETRTPPTDSLDTMGSLSSMSVGDMGIFNKNQSPATIDQDRLNERAAIISESAADIPVAWADAFARICLMQRPSIITKQGWVRIIDNAGRLMDNKLHILTLERRGWSIADIFGCHYLAPETRQDVKGFLLLLNESESIETIDDKAIGLRTITGARVYYRKPINPSPEKIMIWEIDHKNRVEN